MGCQEARAEGAGPKQAGEKRASHSTPLGASQLPPDPYPPVRPSDQRASHQRWLGESAGKNSNKTPSVGLGTPYRDSRGREGGQAAPCLRPWETTCVQRGNAGRVGTPHFPAPPQKSEMHKGQRTPPMAQEKDDKGASRTAGPPGCTLWLPGPAGRNLNAQTMGARASEAKRPGRAFSRLPGGPAAKHRPSGFHCHPDYRATPTHPSQILTSFRGKFCSSQHPTQRDLNKRRAKEVASDLCLGVGCGE